MFKPLPPDPARHQDLAIVHDAVWTRVIVIDGTTSIEDDADEPANGPLPCERLGINHIDARVRAVGQIVFGALRIDPTNVK